MKNVIVSNSLTTLAVLSLLASASFIACAKTADNATGTRAQVRAAKPSVTGTTPSSTQVQTKGAVLPAKTVGAATAEVIPDKGFEIKTLAKGENFADIFKFAPDNGVDDGENIKVGATCLSGFNDLARKSPSSGLMLLGKSSLVLKRAASSPVYEGAFVLILRCGSDRTDSNDVSSINDLQIERKKMKSGDKDLSEAVITSDDGKTKKSVLTAITCSEKIVNKALTGNNGILLIKGSTLLVVRDLAFKFADGSDASGLAPVALIECQ